VHHLGKTATAVFCERARRPQHLTGNRAGAGDCHRWQQLRKQNIKSLATSLSQGIKPEFVFVFVFDGIAINVTTVTRQHTSIYTVKRCVPPQAHRL